MQSVHKSTPRRTNDTGCELALICPTCSRGSLRVVARDLVHEGVYLFVCGSCSAVWEWESVA